MWSLWMAQLPKGKVCLWRGETRIAALQNTQY